MATAVFDGTGADGTDWSAADNWSGGSGASGVPGAADDVEVRALTKHVTGNTAAFAAINIASFKVTGACERSLGATSSPITFGTVTALEYAGKGEGCAFSGTVTAAQITVGQGRHFVIAGGTWSTVQASGQGRVIKGASGTVSALESNGVSWEDEAGAAYVTVTIPSGTGAFRCTIGTLYAGTQVKLEGAAAISTKLWVWPTGRVVDHSSGTIANAEVFPRGLLTYSGTPQTAKTMTNHKIWAGSTVQKASPGFRLTESNAPTYQGYPISVGVPSDSAGGGAPFG